MSGLPVQEIDLTFSPPENVQGGIRQDIDPRVAPIGTWCQLTNVVFVSEGMVGARNGYAATADTVWSEGGARAIDPLVRLDVVEKRLYATWTSSVDASEKLIAYVDTADQWIDKDWNCPVSLTRTPAARPSGTAQYAQSIPVDELTFSVWAIAEGGAAAGGIWVTAVETATGASVMPPTRINATAENTPVPILLRAGHLAIIVATLSSGGEAPGDALMAWSVDTTDPGYSIVPHVLVFASPGVFIDCYDACPNSDNTFTTAYYVSRNTTISLDTWETSGWTSLVHADQLLAGGAVACNLVAVAIDGSYGWLAWHQAGPDGIYGTQLAETTLVGAWSPTAVSADDPYRVSCGIRQGTNEGEGIVIWSVPFSMGLSGRVGIGTFWVHVTGPTLSEPIQALYRGVLSSRPFQAAGRLYAVITSPYGDETQAVGGLTPAEYGFAPPYVVVVCLDNSPLIDTGSYVVDAPLLAARCAEFDAWAFGYGQPPTHVLPIDQTATFLTGIAVTDGGVLTVADGTPRTTQTVGVDTLSLDFATANGRMSLTTAPAGDAVSAGGFTGSFDGCVFSELGFPHPPCIVDVVKITALSEQVLAGTDSEDTRYLYVAVYEWTDARGVTHVSAPSAQATFIVPQTIADNPNGGVTLSVTCCQLTRKGKSQDGPNDVVIGIYRNDPAYPFVFYRITGYDPYRTSAVKPPLNDKNAILVTYDDLQASGPPDAPLLGKQGFATLYTSGGRKAADSSPPSTAVCSFKHRLWIASADDPQAVYFSREFVQGEAPAFSRDLFVRLDDTPERVTAIAGLHEKLLIWTDSRLYYTWGEGPSDTGQGGEFAEPVLVSPELGCDDARSLAVTMDGAYFVSGGDIWFVDPEMRTSRIGAAVQGYLAEFPKCLQVSVDITRELVVFLMTDARARTTTELVWSYRWNRWVTWQPNASGPLASQTFCDGTHYFTDGISAFKESKSGANQYTDSDGSMVSAVMQTQWVHGGAVGGWQRYRYVTLNASAAAPMQWNVRHERDYVTDLFGANQTFQAGAGAATFRAHVQYQQCQSFRLTIASLPPIVLDPEQPEGGFSMSSVTVELGIKQGGANVAAGNRS